MAGDTLARGGKSAVFGPAKVSQEKWDAVFADYKTDPKALASFESKIKFGK
jgi:hypothetical protein